MGSCPSRSRRKAEQRDVVQKWRASHSSSVRSSMIARKDGNIEDDYFLDMDQVLGKGACGVVVTGERKTQQKEKLYAIKICDKSVSDAGRLEREILLLGDVDHCNIVRLFEVYCTPLTMHFVTELCSGGHLGALLNKQTNGGIAKRLDEEDAKALGRQLLSAVRHLHERGIAHRDIKLQNILVDRPVHTDKSTQDEEKKSLSQMINLKIIDFGYGSRYVGCCPMKTVCGTPYTTAPEVLRESYDERCDVWSVGVVLFIMLSGKRPFESLNVRGPLTEAGKAAMTTNILAGRYSFGTDNWTGVSQEAKNFVNKLLAPNYKQRVHAKEAMLLPWMRDLTSTSMKENSEKIRSISRDLSFGNNSVIGGSTKVYPSDKAGSGSAANTPPNERVSLMDEPTPGSALENAENELVVTNILKNTQSASAQSEMRRCGNMALAFGLQEDAVSDIRVLFQTLDLDGSGSLSRSEFAEAMMILCPTLSEPDCALVFNTMDINRDDQITFTEFLSATLNPEAVDIAELNDAFSLLDSNNDGFISLDEIRQIYSFKHMKKKRPVHRRVDTNDSGGQSDSPATSAKLADSQSQSREGTEPTAALDEMCAENNQLPKIFTSALMARNQELSLEEQIESMISACDIDHDGKISHEEFIFAMTGAMDLFDGNKEQASQVLSASASNSKLRRSKSIASNNEGAEETKTPSANNERNSLDTSLYDKAVDEKEDEHEVHGEALDQHFSEERRKLSLTPVTAGAADLSEDNNEVI